MCCVKCSVNQKPQWQQQEVLTQIELSACYLELTAENDARVDGNRIG